MAIASFLARARLTLETLEDRLLLSLAPATGPGENALAVIRGIAFDDLNADGQRQSGEPGQPGRIVFLDGDRDGRFDAGETSTVTAADGSYTFTNLPAGRYVVGQALPGGWEPTSTVISAGAVLSSNADRLIGLDRFRSDRRFSGIDGRGFAVAVLDTGIAKHSYFGPDRNGNGVADSIVYQADFLDKDAQAEDEDGHGTYIASLIGSRDRNHPGIAPGVDLIVLRVLDSEGNGNFANIEKALQWVLANASKYRIAAVNLSLGDGSYHTSPVSLHGIGDELAALAARNVLVVSAAGNDHDPMNNDPGVTYPAIDPNVVPVGAVWDSNKGGPWEWDGGARDESTGPDRIVSFSQRAPGIGELFAPGALLAGAAPAGGTQDLSGTSAAAALVSGAIALAQQLAQQRLGRVLTTSELRSLLQTTGRIIHDGDDEQDNVAHTNADYRRLDVHALAEAILALGSVSPGPRAGTIDVQVQGGKTVSAANLGNRPVAGNYPPVLIGNGRNSNVAEDSLNPAGVRVVDLLGTTFTDADALSPKGIAVVGLTALGRWQYSLDGGRTWLNLTGASRASARLLREADLVRFVPPANFNGPVTLTYLGWDQTSGSAGQAVNLTGSLAVGGRTAFSSQQASARFTVTPVNDAPVLIGTTRLSRTLLGQPSPTGDRVGDLMRGTVWDIDPTRPPGMAVVSATGQGRWQFSRDGERTWLDLGPVSPEQARLLADVDRIRFVPALNWRGLAQLEYRAWDQATNRSGDRVNLSGNRVGGTTAFSAGKTTTVVRVGGTWVSSVVSPSLGAQLVRLGKPLAPGQGIAVVGVSGPGRWDYSFAGRVWYDLGTVSVGNARLLAGNSWLRFVPASGLPASGRLSYQVWNGVGTVGSLIDPRKREVAGRFGPLVWTVDWAA